MTTFLILLVSLAWESEGFCQKSPIPPVPGDGTRYACPYDGIIYDPEEGHICDPEKVKVFKAKKKASSLPPLVPRPKENKKKKKRYRKNGGVRVYVNPYGMYRAPQIILRSY